MPGEPPSWDDDQSWHQYPRQAGRPQSAYGPEVLGLPASPASVGLARAAVKELLGSWGAGRELCGDAVLVVSELVTNALTHTGSDRVVCRLRVTADRLRIEVEDQNRGGTLPERREPDDDDQNGRGLMLVGALTTDWGVGNGTQGCVVWAELAWESAELPLGATRSPSREAESPTGETDSSGWATEPSAGETDSSGWATEPSAGETESPGWEAELPTGEAGSPGWGTGAPAAEAGSSGWAAESLAGGAGVPGLEAEPDRIEAPATVTELPTKGAGSPGWAAESLAGGVGFPGLEAEPDRAEAPATVTELPTKGAGSPGWAAESLAGGVGFPGLEAEPDRAGSPVRVAELSAKGADSPPGPGSESPTGRAQFTSWQGELPTSEAEESAWGVCSPLPEASVGAVRSGRAIPVADGGVPSLAAASVPAIPRPRVTSPDVTRPVPRSAEGHLPHGTPAHP
ncbi:ATP-binding protein [Streptomyces phyllanthi]|uniref:ATP-binding protein n=1 Tax=Streptomyces phyllanthi TaxID=1803180 RepID=UPI001D14689A|nr:ATP-binding protein [Streptomyces phyllanthi]